MINNSKEQTLEYHNMHSSFYRKIWEEHYGNIPCDSNGRTYEIHHKDGNRNNNQIENLVCLSIEDHYKIHFEQGDWSACLRMSKRMELSPEQKSFLATKATQGKIFITDGVNDRRIVDTSTIPDGWKRGRTKGKRFGARSEEFCKKMSTLKKGKPLSEKHKESLKGLKRGMSGKTHTDEAKIKISASNKGVPKSDEHKKALSLAKRKNRNVG